TMCILTFNYYTKHTVSICIHIIFLIIFNIFFFNNPPPTDIYTLSLHDALPICPTFVYSGLNQLKPTMIADATARAREAAEQFARSEEHTSELQSLAYLVCRLLLEKKKKNKLSDFSTAIHFELIRK